jgi:hypothetical protein
LKVTYTDREIPAEHFHKKKCEKSFIFKLKMRNYWPSQNGLNTAPKVSILARIFER